MQSEEFADPRRIAKWTQGLWIALAIVHAVLLNSYILQYRFVLNAASGAFRSHEALVQAARENDVRHGAVALVSVILLVVAVIMMFRWIHRAMRNVRALGAIDTITPTGAVGWFFAPFANFVMPYIAMSQIWRGSIHAADWNQQRISLLVPVWWLLWVVVALYSFVIIVLSRNIHTLDSLRTLTAAGMPYSFLQAARDIAVAAVVHGVTERQTRQHTESVSTVHTDTIKPF